jgi:hypothetical protein
MARRMVAPDKRVAETEIGGTTYRPNRGGIYEVSNRNHIEAMKAEGFFEASLNPIGKGDGAKGFTCVECGFGSWFRKCSRCGHENGTPARDGE